MFERADATCEHCGAKAGEPQQTRCSWDRERQDAGPGPFKFDRPAGCLNHPANREAIA